jgi:hypothetical protein
MAELMSDSDDEGGCACATVGEGARVEHLQESAGRWEGYDPDILLALDE